MIKAILVNTLIRPRDENISEFREQPCFPTNFQCLDVKTRVWISSDIWAKLTGTTYWRPPSCLFTCLSPPSSTLLKLLEGDLFLSAVWISHWQAPNTQIILIPQREPPGAHSVTKVQCAVGISPGLPTCPRKNVSKRRLLQPGPRVRGRSLSVRTPDKGRKWCSFPPQLAGASRRWALSLNSSRALSRSAWTIRVPLGEKPPSKGLAICQSGLLHTLKILSNFISCSIMGK